MREPYVLSIRRLAVFLIILANFVEIVFVELAHETGKVAVFEVFGEYGLGELLALNLREPSQRKSMRPHNATERSYLENHEAIPFITPAYYGRVGGVLQHSTRMVNIPKRAVGRRRGGTERVALKKVERTYLYSLRT